jgi:predicted phosphodiesterase
MNYLIFSDIHSNREGWEALKTHPLFVTSRRICLGDVLDATDPDETFFDEVSSNVDSVLLGNHEAVLIGQCEIEVFNPNVRQQIQENIKAVPSKLLEQIKKIPRNLTEAGASLTHASFNPSTPWKHIRYIEDLNSQAPHLHARVNILGHGHIPFVAWVEDGLWYYERQIYNREFHLNKDTTYIINCGSLLGSREMRHRERTCLVFNPDEQVISFLNFGQAS